MKVFVIIPAAGLGTRMAVPSSGKGPLRSKQFLELDGVPILIHTLRKFASCPQVDSIWIAMRKPEIEGDKMIPLPAWGLKAMSIGFLVDEETPMIWRGPMVMGALEQMMGQVEWGPLDILVVDMPPGTGDVALSMSQYLPATEVYVVTTPQPAAKRVAQRSAYMARKLNLPLRGVIENMSWFSAPDGTRYEIFGQGGGAQLAEELGVPLLGQIPLVAAIREGGDAGRPVVAEAPSSEAAAAFRQVADRIVGLGRTRVFRSELRVN